MPRFRKITEIPIQFPIQMLDIVNDKLAVATEKFIAFYNILHESKRYKYFLFIIKIAKEILNFTEFAKKGQILHFFSILKNAETIRVRK